MGGGGGGGDDVALPACAAWTPSAGSWSTLPANHPATIEQGLTTGLLRPSASGRHVYTVGVWLDNGATKRRVLRSDDVGDSWCAIESPASVVDVIPAPAREATLYAVTTTDAAGHRALLRTADGGATWTSAAQAVPAAWVSAAQQPIVVGADPGVLWFTDPDRLTSYRSRDGGDSWDAVALPVDAPIVDPVIIDPVMSNRLFVPGASKVSSDWGATWQFVSHPAFNPCTGGWPYGCGFSGDSSSILYAADAITSNIGGVTAVKVWASTNWAADWIQLPDAASPYYGVPRTLGSHAPGALFVPSQAGLLGSEDGGRHWNVIMTANVGNTPYAIVALTARALIRGTSTGAEATTDGGGTWRALPSVRAPASLVASPVAPYPVWGDNAIVRSNDGGLTWSMPRTGPPVATAAFADGADAQVAYATSAGQVIRTENGGATWEALTSPSGHPIAALAVCPPPRSCLFVVDSSMAGNELMFRSDDHGRTWAAPTRWTNWDTRSGVVVSPGGPDHMLQGRSDAIYETSDGGQTWNYHPLGQAVVGVVYRSQNDVVAVTVARVVLESGDGGVTWTPAASQPPSGQALRLVQSTRRPRTLFIITGDADAPLVRSDDAGGTWTAVPRLGDSEGDAYASPVVSDVVDVGDRFLASVSRFGLVWFQ